MSPETSFEVLLKVQDLDTHIAQLKHRVANLEERSELDALERRKGELGARAAELEGRRKQLADKQADLEHQVAVFDERRKAIEKRMLEDRGSSPRDLQAMSEEVRHLQILHEEFEDIELGLMEEQEPIDDELGKIAADLSNLDDAAQMLRTSLGVAEAVVSTELSTAEMQRDVEAARLPADLADRYERLRARLKGTGAARLVGNRCDGCHLELPAVEVDRIRHLPPDEVVTCDQCGRILVRPGT